MESRHINTHVYPVKARKSTGFLWAYWRKLFKNWNPSSTGSLSKSYPQSLKGNQGAVGMAVQTTSVSLTFMLHLEHEAWTNIQVSAFLWLHGATSFSDSHQIVAFVTTTIFDSHSLSVRGNETVQSCCFHPVILLEKVVHLLQYSEQCLCLCKEMSRHSRPVHDACCWLLHLSHGLISSN